MQKLLNQGVANKVFGENFRLGLAKVNKSMLLNNNNSINSNKFGGGSSSKSLSLVKNNSLINKPKDGAERLLSINRPVIPILRNKFDTGF